ncbi:MAG: DNA-processing protein DprA [Ignavibacteria bacterium]|nr:DNA-processing protein DprA [Ignavibacteria bacterium]
MNKFNTDDLIALIQLCEIEGLGVNKVRNLVNHFGSPLNAINADYVDLVEVEGINQTLAKRIVNENINKKFFSKSEEQINLLEKFKANIITFWDEEYPYYLRKIYDPPVYLFIKGNILEEDENAIAVVGTRNPTHYGKKITEKITSELVEQGITIVSGLARGIDTIAHQIAIQNKGRTFAVLGSGLDVIYPAENKKLFYSIIENGCLISEYLFGTKPDAMNFPKRNRIISGLSLGTVIIETDISGGAMLTARYALDQNREVFAIPGNIDVKQSRGTNYLIQTGQAKLITNVNDILEEFGERFISKEVKAKEIDTSHLNIFEHKIYEILNSEPLHIDIIAEKTELTTSECLVHLLSLEFKNLVKSLPGKYFTKA